MSEEYTAKLVISDLPATLDAGETYYFGITNSNGTWFQTDEVNLSYDSGASIPVDFGYDESMESWYITVGSSLKEAVSFTLEVCLRNDSGCSVSRSLTAVPKPSSIRLDTASLTLVVGDAIEGVYILSPTVLPADAPQDVEYETSNAKVVQVYDTGMLQAMGVGTTTVTVRAL